MRNGALTVCLLLGLVSYAPCASASPTSSRDLVQTWNPTRYNVAKFEAALRKSSKAYSDLDSRVRVYLGVIEKRRRYIIGVILIPFSKGVSENGNRLANEPRTWPAGTYIVGIKQFPSRVSTTMVDDPSWIQLSYDVKGDSLVVN